MPFTPHIHTILDVQDQLENATQQNVELERLEQTVHGRSAIFVNTATGQRYELSFLERVQA